MSYRTTRSPGLRHALRRAATAVAAAALLCGPAAGVATAAGPGAGGPAHLAPADPSQQFLHLSIESVTPQLVEPNSPATVTVVGSVANIGDRDVSDVQVRIQRANRVAEPEQVRTVLQLDQDNYDTVGDFHQVSDVLKEGATATFALSLPLRSATETSLDITEPGVYPLLVNVNGTPDYGGPARLDDARFLLPVLGLPATQPAASGSEAPALPPVLPTASPPVPITMLYPLANTPKLAAGIPGQPGDSDPTTRLVDDTLADSLAPGGRLHGMLAALDEAVLPGQAVPDPAVSGGLCLAIDPDLLVTVDAMTRGYLVTTDPADPTADTTPGTGREAATNWLSALRALAGAMCTVALPYAQAELDAVAAVGNPELFGEATLSPEAMVDQILGTTSVPGMLWPATGQMLEDTAAALAAEDPTTLLLASNATSAGGSAMRIPVADAALSATSFDVPTAAALAATGSDPTTPAFVPEHLTYRVLNDSRVARLQDALGAIVWPMIPASPAPGSQAAGPTAPQSSPPTATAPSPEPVILAPPQLWAVDHDEAAALLTAYQRLLANGLGVARPLQDVLAQAQAPAAPVAGLVDPVPGDGIGEPPGESGWAQLAADVSATLPQLASLRSILVDVPNAALTADDYLGPLAHDLLRTLSTAGRDGADPQAAEDAARDRLQAVDASLGEQFQAITVVAPGSVYTLASSQSPLLLVAKNDLPIAVRVRLEITAPEGVNIHNVDDYTLPARGSRQIQVPAEIEFSRQIDLRVGLLTPDGAVLGEEIHISLHSNAYGNLIPIVTAIFGALLFVLAGRRAWHRIKGKPDPSDERRPVITPPDQPGAEG